MSQGGGGEAPGTRNLPFLPGPLYLVLTGILTTKKYGKPPLQADQEDSDETPTPVGREGGNFLTPRFASLA